MVFERLAGRQIYTPQPINSVHPLNRGLIGWWGHFPGLMRGGTVIDLCGRNPGAFVGGTATQINSHASNRPGGYGAWDLDGSDDYVSIPHSSLFDTGAVLTVAVSFRLDSAGDAGFLVDKMVGVFNDGWTLQHASGTLIFYQNASSSNLSGGTLTTGPHHAVVVIDGAGANVLYLDGVAVDTDTKNQNIDSTEPLKFGAHLVSFGNFTDGKIDDVRLYNRALSADEVRWLYRELRLGYPSAANWSLALRPLVSTVSIAIGSTAWGHDTGVTETNIRDFAGNWTGTGTIEGSGDAERIKLEPGQSMTSDIRRLSGTVEALQNFYNAAGDDVLLEYRHGSSQAACESASWNTFSAPFTSDGYVQLRVTSTL